VWLKVDDSLSDHPKVVTVPLRAMGLWVLAGAWSGRHLTDGHVPVSMLPAFRANRRDAQALVDAGLWQKVEQQPGEQPRGDLYVFHDWQDWQPSRVQVLANRDALARRQRALRARRATS
jgi:hypothetical protein